MANETALTDTYGALLTYTTREILNSGMPYDQVFKNSALMTWMKNKGLIKELSGGHAIRFNVMHDINGDYTRYSGTDTLTASDTAGHTVGNVVWKQAGVPIMFTGSDLRLNKGANQIQDLQKMQMTRLMGTFAHGLAGDLYSDGTADTNKQLTGLQAALQSSESFTGTYAAIDHANITEYRNQVEATVGAAVTNLIPELRKKVNLAEDVAGGYGGVDGIFTTFAVQETVESLINPAIRYAPNSTGEMSIDPVWRGIPVMRDSYCPSGTLYGLTSSRIHLAVHRDANITMTSAGFQQPTDTDALYAIVIWQGNLVVPERRVHLTLAGIT